MAGSKNVIIINMDNISYNYNDKNTLFINESIGKVFEEVLWSLDKI